VGGLAWTKKRRTQRNNRYKNGGFLTGEEDPHRSRGENISIDGDSGVRSTNQMSPGEALDKTNTTVSSDSADNAPIGSNCSPELEPI
jgi:hypothetical protein